MAQDAPGGRRPAYLEIAAQLRARIEAAELAPHTSLPSERDLSELFGVSRMTARAAVKQLQQEGYVYRRGPRGTFVAEPRIPLRIGSFSQEIARAGRQPSAEVVWTDTLAASADVREALGLRAGDRVHGLQRLRCASGEPLALETTYFPERLCPDLLDGPLDGSLWQVLRDRAGIVPVRASASLEVVTADADAATRLDIAPGTAVLLLVRRTFDADDQCFEVARDLYRADRAEFHIDAPIPADATGIDAARAATGHRGQPG
jgi:GntR family transcriptional regulator